MAPPRSPTNAARSLLRSLGVEVVARKPRNFPRLRRPLLIAEEGITLVLDVGANAGQWAREVRGGGYESRLVSFEPGRAAFERLELEAADDPLWDCRRLAVGSRAGIARLNVTSNSVSSSLLETVDARLPAVVATEEVEVARLDAIQDLAGSERILLKADVEGGELDVLEGARGLLDETRLVELELSAVPLRTGQPLLGEVVHWCEQAGFRLTGIEVSHRDRGTGDVLSANGFFRRVS